jgi:hypothetical protein
MVAAVVLIRAVPGLERTDTRTAFRVYSKQDLERAWHMFE